ncbi:unnamed protein product [Trichobilharzia szidati]|nr:unnamed protein product [Trichobilharzia szidati]
MTDSRFSVGILTVSDTCSKDISLDKSGTVAEQLLQAAGFDIPLRDCVPDDKHAIRSKIIQWIKSSSQVEVIFTLGGTGLSSRDVTSDVILQLIPESQRLPGIVHCLYSVSLQHTPMAALSRFVAGVYEHTLLITLPGSVQAASQCIPTILPVMKHAIHQIKGWDQLVKQEHSNQYNHNPCKSILTNACSVVNRCRQSKHPMISVDEALKKIFTISNNNVIEIEAVFHKNALNRVLGRSLKAREHIPPFDASIMDGYAIQFKDGGVGGQLKVIGALCAGDSNLKSENGLVVTSGTCVRVSTGGPIPPGADCVVPVEHTKLISKRFVETDGKSTEEEEEDIIEVTVPPEKVNQFIRPRGFDLKKSDIFKRGLRLGPVELGLISAAGLLTPWPTNYTDILEDREDPIPIPVMKYLSQGGYLPCLKQYSIGVLSTGNEVFDGVVPEIRPCIRDSNRPVLINLLRQHNYHNVIDFGILPDDRQSVYTGLSRALASCDILITSGGVSMGERDIISQILVDEFQATLHFGRVFMKPGKPTTFLSVPRCTTTTNATTNLSQQSVLVFCLPGNPVSCYVTTHLFVLPLLRKLDAKPPEEWCFPIIQVRLLHTVKLSDRPDYRRAKLIWKHDPSGAVQPASIPCASCESMGSQMSSRLASCLDTNLLLILPECKADMHEICADSVVSALLINSMN